VVDALLKRGIVGAAAVVVIILLALSLAWKAALVRSMLPLGMVVAYIVIGIAQADQSWLAMSMPWMWLVLATTLAGREFDRQVPIHITTTTPPTH